MQWIAGAEAAAKSSVGDPGATRTIYAIVVVLVLLAAALLYFAVRFWQRTRPGVEPARRSARSGQQGRRESQRPQPDRGDRREPSRRPDQRDRPAQRDRPEPRNRPDQRDPRNRPVQDPSGDPFEDDPWWDTRAPRPRPKQSLRDPLL